MLRLNEQFNTSSLGTQIKNQSDTQSEYQTETEAQTKTVQNTEKVKCSYCFKYFTKREWLNMSTNNIQIDKKFVHQLKTLNILNYFLNKFF